MFLTMKTLYNKLVATSSLQPISGIFLYLTILYILKIRIRKDVFVKIRVHRNVGSIAESKYWIGLPLSLQ